MRASIRTSPRGLWLQFWKRGEGMNPIQRDLANLHDHYGPAFLAELETYLRRARLVQQQEGAKQ